MRRRGTAVLYDIVRESEPECRFEINAGFRYRKDFPGFARLARRGDTYQHYFEEWVHAIEAS